MKNRHFTHWPGLCVETPDYNNYAVLMNHRPMNIETERLLLVRLLPEDIEALIAGDAKRVALQTGFTFPPDDPNRDVDLSWHLRALRTDRTQLAWRIRVNRRAVV